MKQFKFHYPITVRYGDLDPQGHLNNAKYFTYMEQARISYIQNLGLWSGETFLDVGIILADAKITFRKSIVWGQNLVVGVRISRLGNKSVDMEYILYDADDNTTFAEGSTVLVAYDYRTEQTMQISDHWRKIVMDYEKLSDN